MLDNNGILKDSETHHIFSELKSPQPLKQNQEMPRLILLDFTTG